MENNLEIYEMAKIFLEMPQIHEARFMYFTKGFTLLEMA